MGFLDKAKKLAGREHTDTQQDAPAPDLGHPLAAEESATPPHGDPLAGAAIPEPGSDRTRPTAARRVPAPPPPPPGDGWGPARTPRGPPPAAPAPARPPAAGTRRAP